jgi:hypothetical protein
MKRALAIALFALAGCAQGNAGLSAAFSCPDGSTNCQRPCMTDICNSGTGVRVPALHFELTPPPDSAYVRTQLLDVPSAMLTPELSVVLPAPTELDVSIFEADGTTTVSGSLTLIGAKRIPTRQVDMTAQLANAVRSSHVIKVLPGDYQAKITRADGRPGLQTSLTVRPSSAPIAKEFHFNPYRRLYGTVQSSITNGSKVAGALVSARSIVSNLASTSTITDQTGSYALDLPDTEDTAFDLVAMQPPILQPAWGYEETVHVDIGQDRSKDINLEPTSDAIRGTATIRIGGQGDGFVPIANASVTLTATNADPLATKRFSVSATTDQDGNLVIRDNQGIHPIQLLSSQYAVTIDPPLMSRFVRTSTVIDLSYLSPSYKIDMQIVLPLATPVVGTVVSDLGRPIAQATIELQPLDGSAPTTVRTDDTGAFDLVLAPGEYLMTMVPATITDSFEVPPVSVQKIEVMPGALTTDLGTIALPRGTIVTGMVQGEIDGAPLSDVNVEAFVEAFGQVISLGSTKSNASGGFTLVLPEHI